ncbi:hypothetical protein DEA98_22565 [Brucella pseudogrignonensis]|nr:hypothetical protein [Brucella pseudogrignonensis]
MSIEMQPTHTKETLFKPTSSVKESIAERIDRTARSIQKVETDARIAKTLRLRKARMEYEQTIVPPVAKRRGHVNDISEKYHDPHEMKQ